MKEFEKVIRKACIDEGISLAELSIIVEYNSPANFSTAIKHCTLGDKYLVPVSRRLKQDVGELFKLKLESRNESSS